MTVEMRPVDSIKVTDRVRDTVGDLHELVDSLRERGLINPVTIQEDGTLIAGERRLTAARELGWDEIACHVWQDDTADELLAIEIEENTCRAQLTLTEAEKAWHHYRILLGLPENGDRSAAQTGNQNATADKTVAPGATVYRASEKAAQAVGYGRPTMERVQEIRETAEDEAEPEPVRQVAQEELGKLSKSNRGAVPALEKVRLAKRQATRDVMAPGQWLKGDEPQTQPKAVTWRDRLWKQVGAAEGAPLRAIAEELELDPDTGSVSSEDLGELAAKLQSQINDRQYLRKVLLNIRKERK
jgi:ParB family transcriptional regulator, chromosome partitioning protein